MPELPISDHERLVALEALQFCSRRWRVANPNIREYWDSTERAAASAIRNGQREQFQVFNDFLFYTLPSDRRLAYCSPRLGDEITFMGHHTTKHQWMRLSTYGGKLVENITQAVARDLMAEAKLRLNAHGYPPILSVHDEVICEVPINFGSTADFEQIMCELPTWAAGLPIAAKGFEAERYAK